MKRNNKPTASKKTKKAATKKPHEFAVGQRVLHTHDTGTHRSRGTITREYSSGLRLWWVFLDGEKEPVCASDRSLVPLQDCKCRPKKQ